MNSSQPHVSKSKFAPIANCQNCGSFFHDVAVRVQYPTANPKRWKTFGWFCESCAKTLGYIK